MIELRNEFNSYPSYTKIRNMGWGSLRFMKQFIKKRKLFQPMLYEYKFGSY